MPSNYDDAAKALLEDAEKVTREDYKREFLGTDCLLMAAVRAPGVFSNKLAEMYVDEASVNRGILYVIGEEDFKSKSERRPPVSDVRIILYRASERAARRGGKTELITVGDITIELLKHGDVARRLLTLSKEKLGSLIEELAKLNGDPPEAEPDEQQDILQQMEQQFRAS